MAIHPDATKELYVKLLAGGKGFRLFPYSTDACPKPFCLMDDQQTFIQAIVRRYLDLGVDSSHIQIVTTNTVQSKLARQQLQTSGIAPDCEICQIDPQLGYAGAMIQTSCDLAEKIDNPQAIVICTPADQYIEGDREFTLAITEALKNAINYGRPTIIGAQTKDLTTATGCGHVIYQPSPEISTFTVLDFVEKPDSITAQQLISRPDAACNTGILVWPITVAKTAKRLLAIPLQQEKELCTSILMNELRPSHLMLVVPKIKWLDCGTLDALYRIIPKPKPEKNASLGLGRVDIYQCTGCLFVTPRQSKLHASHLEGVAVVINRVGQQIVIVVVAQNESQTVKEFAEKFDGDGILKRSFTLKGGNNRVTATAVKNLVVGFVGVSNHTVSVLPDTKKGSFIVSVSYEGDGERF